MMVLSAKVTLSEETLQMLSSRVQDMGVIKSALDELEEGAQKALDKLYGTEAEMPGDQIVDDDKGHLQVYADLIRELLRDMRHGYFTEDGLWDFHHDNTTPFDVVVASRELPSLCEMSQVFLESYDPTFQQVLLGCTMVFDEQIEGLVSDDDEFTYEVFFPVYLHGTTQLVEVTIGVKGSDQLAVANGNGADH